MNSVPAARIPVFSAPASLRPSLLHQLDPRVARPPRPGPRLELRADAPRVDHERPPARRGLREERADRLAQVLGHVVLDRESADGVGHEQVAHMIAPMGRSAFRQIGAERADEWVAKGHRRRHFFAHRLFQLPKCGPDGYKLAQAMCGDRGARPPLAAARLRGPRAGGPVPARALLRRRRALAPAALRPAGPGGERVARGASPTLIHTMVHQSDLVQRIGRVREHKTQIENRFRGWPWMLVNGVLAFALRARHRHRADAHVGAGDAPHGPEPRRAALPVRAHLRPPAGGAAGRGSPGRVVGDRRPRGGRGGRRAGGRKRAASRRRGPCA